MRAVALQAFRNGIRPNCFTVSRSFLHRSAKCSRLSSTAVQCSRRRSTAAIRTDKNTLQHACCSAKMTAQQQQQQQQQKQQQQ